MILRILLLTLFIYNINCDFNRAVCDKTKHCLSVPANCHDHPNEECDYIIAYSPINNDEEVEIELYGKRPGSEYVALGFSDDDQMVSCLSKISINY